MNKVLKNSLAMAEIKTAGAELTSFKRLETDCEYIWNGDKKHWASHSPVLFPIVCALNNGETKIDGKLYKIGNHGFVRKSEFDLIEDNDNKAVYKITYNEETLAMYPFKFELYITYTLKENQLEVKYRVVNVDHKDIYFQIGTHPGFNCPIGGDGGNFEDYYLEFECQENLERFFMNSSNVLVSGKSENIPLQNGKVLPLTHEIFYNGALVLRNLNSKKITLKSNKSGRSVALSYEDLPYMGLWQPKDAPFICIEPWHGIADQDDFKGEFKEKEMMIHLVKGNSYECFYTIEIE